MLNLPPNPRGRPMATLCYHPSSIGLSALECRLVYQRWIIFIVWKCTIILHKYTIDVEGCGCDRGYFRYLTPDPHHFMATSSQAKSSCMSFFLLHLFPPNILETRRSGTSPSRALEKSRSESRRRLDAAIHRQSHVFEEGSIGIVIVPDFLQSSSQNGATRHKICIVKHIIS